jgi:hypothetical protein
VRERSERKGESMGGRLRGRRVIGEGGREGGRGGGRRGYSSLVAHAECRFAS